MGGGGGQGLRLGTGVTHGASRCVCARGKGWNSLPACGCWCWVRVPRGAGVMGGRYVGPPSWGLLVAGGVPLPACPWNRVSEWQVTGTAVSLSGLVPHVSSPSFMAIEGARGPGPTSQLPLVLGVPQAREGSVRLWGAGAGSTLPLGIPGS